MIGIVAKKIGMTSIYRAGRLVACTVLETRPCVITQIKTMDTDGYESVQLAYEEKKDKNTTKPLQGHFKAANTTPKRGLIEFRNFLQNFTGSKVAKGDTLLASSLFEAGEFVDVVGISKGKGFSGVMKRHGFGGVGQQTHGQHNRERSPGAIGACATPARVFKGTRMAGRAGAERVTTKNLRVEKIMPEEKLMIVRGAVPGPNKNYVIVQK